MWSDENEVRVRDSYRKQVFTIYKYGGDHNFARLANMALIRIVIGIRFDVWDKWMCEIMLVKKQYIWSIRRMKM